MRERDRTDELKSRFQRLLEEKCRQDEEVKDLFEAAGVTEADLAEVNVPEALAAHFDDCVQPASRPARPNRTATPLCGLVLRG